MPNYSSALKSWGSYGAEYPDNYAHVEGERPVDDWENYLKGHLIDDVSHLINVTNDPVTVNAGTQLTGGGNVELGGSITLNVDENNLNADLLDGEHASAFADSGHLHDSRYILESGDSMNGRLSMGTSDLHFQPGSSGGSVTGLTFESNTNAGSDFGYVEYHDDYFGDGTGEESALVLRTENDTTDEVVLDGAGGVSIVTGDLTVDSKIYESGNRVATRTWANSSFDNYSSWTIEEGDGEQTSIGSGQKLEIYGGSQINTEITSTGGESRLRVDHANTTSQGDVTTGGATVIDDLYIDGNGHIDNINTQNRSLDDWGNANADIDLGGNNINSARDVYSNSGGRILLRAKGGSGELGFYDDSTNTWVIRQYNGGDLQLDASNRIEAKSELNAEQGVTYGSNFEITENSSTNSLDFNYTGS